MRTEYLRKAGMDSGTGAPAAEAAVSRSNVCAVCGAVSKHFYLNYGAPVCFSCRAFFRSVVGQRDSKVETSD